jgi:hypothetical protein
MLQPVILWPSTLVPRPSQALAPPCCLCSKLDMNKLSGSLPKEWGSLQKLEYLDVSMNQLSGPLPEDWLGMKALKTM